MFNTNSKNPNCEISNFDRIAQERVPKKIMETKKNKRNIEIDSLLIHRQGLLIIFKKENFQITDFKMEIRIKRSTQQWCIYQKTIVNN